MASLTVPNAAVKTAAVVLTKPVKNGRFALVRRRRCVDCKVNAGTPLKLLRFMSPASIGLTKMANASLKLSLLKLLMTNTNPDHYKTDDGIECIDALRCSAKNVLKGFAKANVLKYCWRYKDKGGKEDLEKAKVYMQWLLDSVQ